MTVRRDILTTALTIFWLVLSANSSSAQTSPMFWTVEDTGNWTDDNNWVDENNDNSLGFSPKAEFEEFGVINNGGTAFLATNAPDTGGIILGQFSGEVGSLEIRNGGSLVSRVGETGLTDGKVLLGTGGGEGHLTVLPGGSFTATSIQVSGSANSLLKLGGTTAGTASLTLSGGTQISRGARIIGPDVAFNTPGLLLTPTTTLIAEITGGTHSAIQVANTANLNGVLKVEFNGHAPTPGESWDIVDAGELINNFHTIDTSAVAAQDPGVGFIVLQQAGGNNGNVVRLKLDAQLLLSVDRRTGSTTINNLTPDGPVDLDAYAIRSPSGLLDSSVGWQSFQDGGQLGWQETINSDNFGLIESNIAGSRIIGPETSIAIGEPYNSPTALEEPGQDLSFEYHMAGAGTVQGAVEYTGLHNNLVLLVDPTNGESAIQNQSIHDISIDAYVVSSESDSLDAAGWVSFEADGQGDWLQNLNVGSSVLGESNIVGSRMLGATGQPIDIGTAFDFDAGGVQQDLQFHFHIADGQTMQGVVEYDGLMPPAIPGDYSNNGIVAIEDLNLVLFNWQAPGAGLPEGWVNFRPAGNVGSPELNGVLFNWQNTASIATVPEPACQSLLIGIFTIGIFSCRARIREIARNQSVVVHIHVS